MWKLLGFTAGFWVGAGIMALTNESSGGVIAFLVVVLGGLFVGALMDEERDLDKKAERQVDMEERRKRARARRR